VTARQEIYDAAQHVLEAAWEQTALPELAPDLAASIEKAIDSPENSQRYGLVTQLLLKAVVPSVDCRVLKAQEGAPSGRSFAKKALVPFEQEHGSPLGGSRDPYVSNPLRRNVLDETVKLDSAHPEAWQAVIDVLTAAEASQAVAAAALAHAVAVMKDRAHTLGSVLQRVMEIQLDLRNVSNGEGSTDERRELVENVAPGVIRPLIEDPLEVEGSVGAGSPAEVPWIRIYAPGYSPSAQSGWYLAYLFTADGSAVYLSLLQGVTHGASLEAEAKEVRDRFSDRVGLVTEIELHSEQGSSTARPRLYERATALARRYEGESLPPESELQEDLAEMCEVLVEVYAEVAPPPPSGGAGVEALTLDAVLAELAVDQVELPTPLVKAAVAAIRAGQHVLLTGAPGTGKTSLAVALAKAAAAAGICTGFDTVTATADWTSAETIGGYWPEPDGSGLAFRRGHVLSAIDEGRWVIIDELNRADIDKAYGPLFTVLSGRMVQLPQLEKAGGELVPVEIAPAEEAAAAAPWAHRVPEGWRILATLNTRDRDLLFNLSYALLRRFAIVDVAVPDQDQYGSILAGRAATGDEDIDARLYRLTKLPHRQLGPAILIDCGKFLHERLALDGAADPDLATLMSEALAAFVFPQLDDLTRTQQADVARYLHQHVLPEWNSSQVRLSLSAVFDLPPGAVTSEDDVAEAPQGEAEAGDGL
jgi:MoxR-like ATPase